MVLVTEPDGSCLAKSGLEARLRPRAAVRLHTRARRHPRAGLRPLEASPAARRRPPVPRTSPAGDLVARVTAHAGAGDGDLLDTLGAYWPPQPLAYNSPPRPNRLPGRDERRAMTRAEKGSSWAGWLR